MIGVLGKKKNEPIMTAYAAIDSPAVMASSGDLSKEKTSHIY